MECPHKTWKHNACVCIYCILLYGSFKRGSSNQITELKLSVFSSNICKVCLFSFFFVLLRMNVLYTRDVLDSVFCWVFTLKQSLSLTTLYERTHTHTTHTQTLEWANPDNPSLSPLFPGHLLEMPGFESVCGSDVWDQSVWKCVCVCVCVCVWCVCVCCVCVCVCVCVFVSVSVYAHTHARNVLNAPLAERHISVRHRLSVCFFLCFIFS